ncbi:hypothetical protein C8F01DRAFT_359 [Mycena amicta]|nr:hypothetical protein C8F01DRAFT_359 [Mycena amicta]
MCGRLWLQVCCLREEPFYDASVFNFIPVIGPSSSPTVRSLAAASGVSPTQRAALCATYLMIFAPGQTNRFSKTPQGLVQRGSIAPFIPPPLPVLQTMSSNADKVLIAAYLRVAADSIALFDYLQTLPAEIRLYRRQKGLLKMSAACMLFIMVRYFGVISIVLANIGFFYHGFSPKACRRWYMLVPIFKQFLYMSSQVILGVRTYAVSRKNPVVLRVVVGLYILCCVPEFIGLFYKRIPVQTNHACTSGDAHGVSVASYFYVGAMIYDLVTMSITVAYLLKFSNTNRTTLSNLAKIILEDTVMYFLALTAMNIMNFIFFRNDNAAIQPAASTLGLATTMIFSARFILNLSEHARIDGLSNEHTHSSRSRSRGNGLSGGRNHGNQTAGAQTDTSNGIVVRVVKDVITMDDMSPIDLKHGVDSEADEVESRTGVTSTTSKNSAHARWGGEIV